MWTTRRQLRVSRSKCPLENKTPHALGFLPAGSPHASALLSLVPLLASPSLSAEPPLSPSAGSPAVPAAASGGQRGEGTPGEPTPALPPRAAARTGLRKQTQAIKLNQK